MALMGPPSESSEEEPNVKLESSVKQEPEEVNQTPAPTPIKEEYTEYLQNHYVLGHPLFSISLENQSTTLQNSNSNTKNIVKNYGKAMCSFAASDLSLTYLLPLAAKENIKIDRFKEYFRCKKELVGSIETFRNLYIQDSTDNEEIKAFKRIFKDISIIFIKYFSVNWIFNGKLTQKQAHLKYRFKMLRRIKNPELFTYLKG